MTRKSVLLVAAAAQLGAAGLIVEHTEAMDKTCAPEWSKIIHWDGTPPGGPPRRVKRLTPDPVGWPKIMVESSAGCDNGEAWLLYCNFAYRDIFPPPAAEDRAADQKNCLCGVGLPDSATELNKLPAPGVFFDAITSCEDCLGENDPINEALFERVKEIITEGYCGDHSLTWVEFKQQAEQQALEDLEWDGWTANEPPSVPTITSIIPTPNPTYTPTLGPCPTTTELLTPGTYRPIGSACIPVTSRSTQTTQPPLSSSTGGEPEPTDEPVPTTPFWITNSTSTDPTGSSTRPAPVPTGAAGKVEAAAGALAGILGVAAMML